MQQTEETQQTITNEIKNELGINECKDIGNPEIWKTIKGYEGLY